MERGSCPLDRTDSPPRWDSQAWIGFFWFGLAVRGERYRGSTKQTDETRGVKIAAFRLAAAIERGDPLDKKAPTLRGCSNRFVTFALD